MDVQPDLPVPISLIGDKYLIFDVNAVAYLRREHHICGMMGGTLPQNPSQNLFLGLPMQIMPEEAQLLLEKGVGYLFDDPSAHDQAVRNYDSARHADYMANVRCKAQQASKVRSDIKEEQRKAALSKQKTARGKSLLQDSDIDDSPSTPTGQQDQNSAMQHSNPINPETTTPEAASTDMKDIINTDLFSNLSPKPDLTSTAPEPLPPVTPTTSAYYLPSPHQDTTPPNISSSQILNLPPSYALYKHLNSKAYFMTPGLRFGCQYCVYPGDPLRFHSHFLAVGCQWDEEIDLMDIVSGGRLGTGVKKGWLIGGEEPASSSSSSSSSSSALRDVNHSEKDKQQHHPSISNSTSTSTDGRMRTFSIEWAAM